MLNQSFTKKPGSPPPLGPRQSGQTVVNPRGQLAIALNNASASNASLSAGPLAQALAAKKKKKKGGM